MGKRIPQHDITAIFQSLLGSATYIKFGSMDLPCPTWSVMLLPSARGCAGYPEPPPLCLCLFGDLTGTRLTDSLRSISSGLLNRLPGLAPQTN